MAADAFDFRFKDLELSGALVSWNDVIGIRVASHRYLKRDGAEQEPMGSDPGRFTMRLAFMGPSWAASYRLLVATIRADPRGLLVHPLLGNMQVICTGISDASCEPGRATQMLDVTISFEEDALDTTVVSEGVPSPIEKAQAINAYVVKFKAVLAPTSSGYGKVLASITHLEALAQTAAIAAAQLVAAVSAELSSNASAYSIAGAATAGGAQDLSLQSKLAAVAASTDATVVALLSPALSTGALAQPAVSLAVNIYAACVQLDIALSASRPPVIPYTVKGAVNLFVLAARLYPGQSTKLRAQDILMLNRVPNPFWISAGTILQLPRPTAIGA